MLMIVHNIICENMFSRRDKNSVDFDSSLIQNLETDDTKYLYIKF